MKQSSRFLVQHAADIRHGKFPWQWQDWISLSVPGPVMDCFLVHPREIYSTDNFILRCSGRNNTRQQIHQGNVTQGHNLEQSCFLLSFGASLSSTPCLVLSLYVILLAFTNAHF